MNARRMGLLGFGHVAEHGHLPAWQQRDDFRIVTVVDPDPQRRSRAAELIPEARIYDTPEAALQRERLDVVDIATPPALHAPLTATAAAAGCHVLCEKPLATSMADYSAALAAVRAAGVTLFTVHNWKHSPQFIRLSELLRQGAIGRLTHLRFETIRSGHAVTVGSRWRAEAARAGGGILVDHGWHVLYLLLSLAREHPRRISATLERRRYTTSDVEDTAACEIEFSSLTGEIYLTWAGEVRRTRWQLRGTAGSLTLEDERCELEGANERREFTFDRSLSAGSHHPDWFGAVIDGFAREIGDRTRRGENLAEAESCLLLTELAYKSGAQGGRPLAVPGSFPGAPGSAADGA